MVYSALLAVPILLLFVKGIPFLKKKKVSKSQKKYSKSSYYRKAHYDALTYSPSINDLYDFLNANKNKVKVNTSIKFKGLEWGSSLRSVILKVGSPRFIKKANYLGQPCLILFCKEKLGKYNVISQMHFIDHSLFLGTYTLSNLNLSDINKIKKQLRVKYSISEEENMNTVLDEKGNIIKMERNHNETHLIYLCGETKIKGFIEELKNKETSIKEQIEELELSNIYEKL